MLIDRVDVVGVVEYHAKEPAEFRNKRAQHPGPVHFQQGFVYRILPLENTEERQVGFRGTTKFVVDHIQMLPQELASFVRQLAIVFLRVVKNPYEIFRGGSEHLRFSDRKMSFR